MVKRREVGLAILWSFLTCGIYGLYWFIKLTDDVAYLSDDDSMTGIKALIFTLITCGIYFIYWNYKIGQMTYQAQERAGVPGKDNSVIYLVLSLFGLGIITYCLVQSDVNNIVK